MDSRSSTHRIFRFKLTIDRALGMVIAVFCVVLLVEMAREHLAVWNNQGPGPGFFPMGLEIALIGLSLMLVLRPIDATSTSTLAKLTTTDRSPGTEDASPESMVTNPSMDDRAEVLGEEKGDVASDEPVPFSRTLKYLLLIALMIGFYASLGALLSMFSFIVIEMLWIERSKWWAAVATATAMTAAVYLVFLQLLSVPLPNGVLNVNFG